MEGCVTSLPGLVQDPPHMLVDAFMQNSYKVEPCMLSHPHGWKVCPYVHPGEPVKRRHPSTHRGDMCPAVKKGLVCHIGSEHCPYAHNSFELWLHPSRYKTKMCRRGADCPRGICFFAHSESELRQRPVHNSNNHTNEVAVAASSSGPVPSVLIPSPSAAVTALGAPGAAAAAGLGAAPAAAASALWMSSLSVPAVPGTTSSNLAGVSPVAGVSHTATAAAAAAASALAAPAPALAPAVANHLLLQQQLQALKLQHEIEMQHMQEKMLLLQLLQQDHPPQSAARAPAVPALNGLVPVGHLPSGVTAAVDPRAAVRSSAASTTATLLSSSSATSSTSPGVQLMYVNNSSSAYTGFSSAAGAFAGCSSSTTSSIKGSRNSSPRNSGCVIDSSSSAVVGSPFRLPGCADIMPNNAMCSNWLGMGCTAPM